MNMLLSQIALPLLLAANGPVYGYSWGLILLVLMLGLMVTLKSSRRTTDFKRPEQM
jgi:hypothetical protein